jgi:hypothetical protein
MQLITAHDYREIFRHIWGLKWIKFYRVILAPAGTQREWWGNIQVNWLPNDSSAEGASSLGDPRVCPQTILKIRTLEMPFPVIWTLNCELQFDFKNGKTLEIVPYF